MIDGQNTSICTHIDNLLEWKTRCCDVLSAGFLVCRTFKTIAIDNTPNDINLLYFYVPKHEEYGDTLQTLALDSVDKTFGESAVK